MQRISETMTRNVQAVAPQDTVRRTAQMMDELNVGALPVCDGNRVVGMVTDRDITVHAVSAGIAPDDAVVDDVMQHMVEKISSPSEPDRSARDDRITASNTGTAAGMAGSDFLAERMNPDVEVSSTADPSDFVEVTPEHLLNRNASGNTALNEKRASDRNGNKVKVVRRNASGYDTSTGETSNEEGIDIGVSGASGSTADTAGSTGTAVGPSP